MITRAEIQAVRALEDKRTRDAEGLFVAEGRKLAGELLASQWPVRRLYALDGALDEDRATILSPREMERISLLKTPSDVVAVVEKPRRRLVEPAGRDRLVLALDQVQNPGNLGTIIRLADWFGIDEIVCSEDSADCFNPKVVQATMGAILRVGVHYVDLPGVLGRAAATGIPIYGTFLDGEELYGAELTPAGIVVMGNEGRGIGSACAEHIGRRLFIPPYPATRHGSESLNVAIATAVVCAEFRRRSAARG